MTPSPIRERGTSDAGYTAIELMITVAILMLVSGAMLTGVMDLSQLNTTTSNRSEMHASVRNATSLMAQEVGQAGQYSLPGAPGAVTSQTVVAAPGAATVTLNPTVANIFVGSNLVYDIGANEETVTVTAVNQGANQITATFAQAHGVGVPVGARGAFSSGVVPTTVANGSTGNVLKIFGDINGDGTLRYVEYSCDVANQRLVRVAVPFDAAAKPAPTVQDILLDNLLANPNASPCFTYQEVAVAGIPYVLGVAITVTVQTQDRDPITGTFQTETKALLNVSPRNVFHAWSMASLGIANRVQPTPASTALLLP